MRMIWSRTTGICGDIEVENIYMIILYKSLSILLP